MDWFKGKFAGNHRFSHEIWGFPVETGQIMSFFKSLRSSWLVIEVGDLADNLGVIMLGIVDNSQKTSDWASYLHFTQVWPLNLYGFQSSFFPHVPQVQNIRQNM